MKADFGSVEAWQKDFKATGAMRGIGWVVLAYDPGASRLFNFWINEHDTGHAAGLPPLVVMDVFEHAYMQDYGVKKDGYLEAFFKALDWSEAARRFQEHAALQSQAH